MNTKPKYKEGLEITLHRDGTVSYYDGREWVRRKAKNISDCDYCFLTPMDRARIYHHAKKQTP